MIVIKKKKITLIKRKWLSKFNPIEYSIKYVSDNPDYNKIKKGEMIIVGGKGYVKWAYFNCPSGCGDIIVLPLTKSKGPNWKLKVNKIGQPTLSPSVWKTDGCKSHFFVRKGKVIWAHSFYND